MIGDNTNHVGSREVLRSLTVDGIESCNRVWLHLRLLRAFACAA